MSEAEEAASPEEDPEEQEPKAPAPSDALQALMDEALASVEARERGEEIEIEVEPAEPEGPPKPDLQEAVTEAIIRGKQEVEAALEQTKKEVQQMRERWLRSNADLDNYRKRAQREKDDLTKFANEKLLKDFLPVVDDIDRTVEAMSGPDDAQHTPQVEQMLNGMQLIQKKFLDQLSKHGVVSFEALGEPFDPNLHDAVQQLPSDRPAGTVCTEMQRGFMINDRLLRAALVIVSTGPAAGAASDSEQDADGAKSE